MTTHELHRKLRQIIESARYLETFAGSPEEQQSAAAISRLAREIQTATKEAQP
jgi:hypothetical protein